MIFEGTGPVDAVRIALKDVANQLCAKQNLQVPIPASLRGRVVGKQGANIVDLKIGRRTPDIYELLLDVEVGSVEQLQRVQAALRATSCVTSVERNLG